MFYLKHEKKSTILCTYIKISRFQYQFVKALILSIPIYLMVFIRK